MKIFKEMMGHIKLINKHRYPIEYDSELWLECLNKTHVNVFDLDKYLLPQIFKSWYSIIDFKMYEWKLFQNQSYAIIIIERFQNY